MDIKTEAVRGGGQVSDVEGSARVKRPGFKDGRAVFIYIMDPKEPTHLMVNAPTNSKAWQWNLLEATKMVVIFDPSLNDLNVKTSVNIPQRRKV